MPYTEEDFERMETDPVLRRQYWWQMGHRSILRAVKAMEDPELKWARNHGILGDLILKNLDKLVETTGSDTRSDRVK